MKSLEDVTSPDDRQRMLVGTLSDFHGELEAIRLNAAVPENVRELFDTAINLSLYAWFVLEFHSIADLTGFLAFEAALRARAATDDRNVEKRSLDDLIARALRSGWITEEGMPGRMEIARMRAQQRKIEAAIQRNPTADSISVDEPTPDEVAAEARDMKVIETMCTAGRRLRNKLAHGKHMLVTGSHRRLRTTADLINQIFPGP